MTTHLLLPLDCAMARIIDFAAPLGQKAGPGRWNDLDMRKSLPRVFFFGRSSDGFHSSDWVGLITPWFHFLYLSLTLIQERWHDVS